MNLVYSFTFYLFFKIIQIYLQGNKANIDGIVGQSDVKKIWQEY